MKISKLWTWLLIVSLLVSNGVPVYAMESEADDSEAVESFIEVEQTEPETENSIFHEVEETQTDSEEIEDIAYEITDIKVNYSEINVGTK